MTNEELTAELATIRAKNAELEREIEEIQHRLGLRQRPQPAPRAPVDHMKMMIDRSMPASVVEDMVRAVGDKEMAEIVRGGRRR